MHYRRARRSGPSRQFRQAVQQRNGVGAHRAKRYRRVLQPQVRMHRDAPRQAVDWTYTLDTVAQRFANIVARHGTDRIVNEVARWIEQFAAGKSGLFYFESTQAILDEHRMLTKGRDLDIGGLS